MDEIRFGRQIRALRQRRGWRQQDLAEAAGVSQAMVSRIERGRFRQVRLEALERVAAAVGVRVELRIMGGPDLDRLLDELHAATVEEVIRRLRRLGWVVEPEVTFSIYGERGSIDVLAWHPATGALLVIEVKTALGDVQATLASFDRKMRLASRLAKERGWTVRNVSGAIVFAENRTLRRLVGRHAATFAAAVPTGGRELLAWMRDPDGGPVRGHVFLTLSRPVTARQRRRLRRRSSPSGSCSVAAPGRASRG
jgi:transcriptional regulator with XRE-family HTH domain